MPSAPSFLEIARNQEYREAVLNADAAITDSALMARLRNLLKGDSIGRLSGLEHLRELSRYDDVRTARNTFLVLAGGSGKIEDRQLVDRLQLLRSKHLVITVGGDTQERLGLYAKRNLDDLPAIRCIGVASAFLSGDQVRIPSWTDRIYLGWSFQWLFSPRWHCPRYFSALRLIPFLWRYRTERPAFQEAGSFSQGVRIGIAHNC